MRGAIAASCSAAPSWRRPSAGWAAAEGKQPQPTALQREYVAQSRNAATRRQRGPGGRQPRGGGHLDRARHRRAHPAQRGARPEARGRAQAGGARSRALAAESENQLAFDPELAILLGAQAVRTQPTSPGDLLPAARPGRLQAATHPLRAPGLRAQRLLPAPRGPDRHREPGHTVRLWNGTTGRQVRMIRPGQPSGIAFSPDSRSLVVALELGGSRSTTPPQAAGRRSSTTPTTSAAALRRAPGACWLSAGMDFVRSGTPPATPRAPRSA